MRLAKWWRAEPKITVATVEQLLKRIEQLERIVGRGNGKTLYKYTEDYRPQEHPGLIRGAKDEVLGAYDPELGAFMLDYQVRQHGRGLMDKLADRLPDSITETLERSAAAYWGDIPSPQGSGVTWRDMLTPRRVIAADGTQVLNTVTETIMLPDFTFAADYMEVGDGFKYTLLGDFSGQAAANTKTVRLRWGGVGGTSMAASGAFAFDPTASSTTLSEMFEFWIVARSLGTAGSIFVMGRATWADFDDASATTLKSNLDMLMIPVSAPAATGSLDTTTAKAISPTITFSSATATIQYTNHIGVLESID